MPRQQDMGCSVSQPLKGNSRSRSVIWRPDGDNRIESKLSNLLPSIRWASLMNVATHLSPNAVGFSSGCNFRKSQSSSEQQNLRQDKVSFPSKVCTSSGWKTVPHFLCESPLDRNLPVHSASWESRALYSGYLFFCHVCIVFLDPVRNFHLCSADSLKHKTREVPCRYLQRGEK